MARMNSKTKAKLKTKAKRKPKFPPIKVTLEFDMGDIQTILNSVSRFGDREYTVKNDLTPAAYKELKKELQETASNFVGEIMDGTDEAMSNDWLCNWSQKHFPEYEDDEEGE